VRLGFFTACLPGLDLGSIAAWAGDNGFAALEVAAWPRVSTRSFEASHLDVANLDEPAAEAVLGLMEKHGLVLSAVAYYENNLHPDPKVRAGTHDHLRRCVDAAQLLGVPHVGTFIGRDWTQPVQANLREAERVIPPLVEYAANHDVKLVIENCQMEGWHPDGYPGNLAYSPELWEWMFGLGLNLNYDPSHLLPLGIDPVSALKPYLDRVLHVQAKDAEIDVTGRNRYGYLGRTVGRNDGWDVGWWRYRVPGLGSVDWRRIIDTLYEGGYDGAVSIEHEDPVWGGREDRVKQGLQIAQRTLSPLIVA
jgi:sugar phosphate isomerase/epimerase